MKTNLTELDKQILKQACKPVKVIAVGSAHSYDATAMRINRLYVMFGVHNRISLIVQALKLGIVKLEDIEVY